MEASLTILPMTQLSYLHFTLLKLGLCKMRDFSSQKANSSDKIHNKSPIEFNATAVALLFQDPHSKRPADKYKIVLLVWASFGGHNEEVTLLLYKE